MSITLWYLDGMIDRVEAVEVADCDGVWVTTLDGTKLSMFSSYHAYTFTRTSAEMLLVARLEAHAADAEDRAAEAHGKLAALRKGKADA